MDPSTLWNVPSQYPTQSSGGEDHTTEHPPSSAPSALVCMCDGGTNFAPACELTLMVLACI
jgi:hypothetical protein